MISGNPNEPAALRLEKHDGVATITMHRPKARNALTTAMFQDMEQMLMEIETDNQVRAVVLTGTGESFSAGADLKPVSKEEQKRSLAPGFPGDAGGDILARGNRCILRLRKLPKPVLGSVNGDAVGIGFSLALAADLRIAADTARFGAVFSRIGLAPDGGASYFLRELVGSARALELLFTGDIIDASHAERLGLVNQVVGKDELEEATAHLASRLAVGPTLAYGFAKQAVYESSSLSLESLLDLETRNQKIAGNSRDAREGVRAFVEKREPDYRGS